MASYKRVQSGRLYEEIVTQIEESILEGMMQEGDQLPAEKELARQFGVSRMAVREAMKVLRQKGLVDTLPGRGTYVTNGAVPAMRDSLSLLMRIQDGDGYDNLAEVREIFEPEIAMRAAMRRTAADVRALEDAIAMMERSSADTPSEFIEADLAFHLALAGATGNTLIVALLDSIIELLRSQRREIFLKSGGARRGHAFHIRILDAVRNHEPVEAREVMRAHLEQVRQDSSPPP